MTDIIEALARHASDRPDATLYTFLDAGGRVTESHTYRGFDARTTALAAGLLHAGSVAPGEHVLLVYPPGLDFITAFFACVKLGAVPVPVAPPDASGFIGGLEKLAYIASDTSVRVALTTDAFHGQMRKLAERSSEGDAWLRREPLSSVSWVATDMIAGGPSLMPSPMAPSHNPLLFLQYTSGSTQRPRGVMVSHDNVIHNAWATLQHRPTGVSWLPHYHDMGLIGYYLFIMITGGSMYGFSGAHFLKRPLLWLETISRYRGSISSAPNFAFEYCLREDKIPDEKLASLDLSSMVCMMNASEPVRASTYERFQARFGRCGLSPKAHMVFYGLAEHTLSVTGNGRVALTVNTSLLEQNQLKIEASRPGGFNQARLMSCGRPLPGVDVRIVAAGARTALADDLIGEIWVGGPSKAKGYLNKPALSESHFGATIDGAGGATYLRTGDIGFMHDGELFICGRLKDMMIIGGRNYYPADIEAVVEAASPKVRTGCVAAFAVDKGPDGEGIAVVAEPRRANDLPDLEEICREIRKRCQIEVDVLAVVPHGTIAKTSSGKIARQSCRSSWELGEVRIIASRERTPRPGVDEVLEDLLNRFDVEGYEERTLADLGIDSLTLVELSLHLERLFDSPGAAGGGRAAETWSDLRILQAITVGELRAFVGAFAASGEIPQIAPELLEARLESIDRGELARMRDDARLPAHIVPTPTPAPATVPPDATVLLTGATGFLGSFLLEALLRLTQYRVVTLVRATSADHARARTESALERTGLLDERLRDAFDARVRVLPGDLAQQRLGLAPGDWTSLSEDLSAIYHCGADVDYVKPYETLRGANVSSAVDIVRLASSGRPKALHYASTTFMFGFVARELCLETDANLEMAGLNFGYAQSKWVAEQLVLDAAARGLTARVYRPSLVTASKDGKYVRRDLMSRILSYMIRHGVSVDSANQISFVPVDVCANNIVALSLLEAGAPVVVHITADHYYTMQDVCVAITRQSGYGFEHVTLERFMDYMNANCPKSDPMFPLLAFFNQNWRRIDLMRDKRYDSAQYRQARAASPLAVPQPSLEDTVGRIVAFLQNEDLVPVPTTQSVSEV
jgi:thioester reductase-like protein